MSAPPRPSNPDRRPLPDGWITRYDEGYRAWYYVDTRAQPPRSAWDHPLDAPPPTSPPGGYQPPPNAPGRNYPSSSQSYNQPTGQGFPAQQQYPGYQGNQQDAARGYQQPYQPQQNYGGPPPANYVQPGWQQPAYQPQGYPAQPPVQTLQQPARGGGGRHGMGAGTALLAGAGGLAAGALLMEGFEHHERREEDQAYDQGLNQGYDEGYDNGQQGFDDGGGW